MIVLEANETLRSTCEEARHFLRLSQADKAGSAWYKSFLDQPTVRSFFKRSVFGKGTVLQVTAITQVALAFVACVDDEPSELLPTAAAVQAVMKRAEAFESSLLAETSFWVPSQLQASFFGQFKHLHDVASAVKTRSAGRPAFEERRTFVLHLARALYEMCGDYPNKFIATVAARVWEDTESRAVRKILTDVERASIARYVEDKRRQTAESENLAHLVVARASIPPKVLPAVALPQTTSEIFQAMLALAQRIPDETDRIVAVDHLDMLRREIGLEPDHPAE
ncbi:hypothetical protein [Burkholderia vietnamiensis]|uniref:hypothetical protein n=1 Tax=Burkholderia vietnamiensis TaxID=60552 RepID=UPI001D13FE75|nr:hypothetical protein [Burkholderia vietnamiensis]UEC03078.1 hypothetical protein LK462_14055 [Burkholderia vietnamiensis]